MLIALLIALALALSAEPGFAQSQPTYVEEGTGRGLAWSTRLGPGGASAAVDGTKVKTLIHGAQKATIVVVADLANVTPLSGVETPWRLALAPTGNSGMSVIVNGVGVIWSGYDWPTAGRLVFHAVIDTTESAAGNRVRLYIDGVEQGTFTSGTAPALNATIDLQTGRRLNLGNNDLPATNTHSIEGRIYYAALYASTLTAAQVATDAAALATDDDTGGLNPGTPPPGSVVFVGTTPAPGAVSASVATLTPGLVPSTAPDDRVLAVVLSRTAGVAPVWTFPIDWEKVVGCHRTGTSNIALEVWKKNGTAPTVSPSITINDIGFGHMAFLLAWRNTPGVVQGVSSDSPAATTWVPGAVTTVNDNARVISIVATPDINAPELQTAGAFTARVSGILWDTPIGPLAPGVADATQGQAGLVAMPTWQQTREAPDPWCGLTIALDLITSAQPAPPPQGGGAIGIPRFILTDRPTGIERPLVAPVVP